MTVGVLLLAAGRARRFGSDKRYAKLKDGRTLLHACIDNIGLSGLPLLVCLGCDDQRLYDELAAGGIDCALCPTSGAGMGSTLADGVRASPVDWGALVVALADMPWVNADTYRSVARSLGPRVIAVPQYRGLRGNPVGFGSAFFPLLERLSGDRGARDIVLRHPQAVLDVRVEDPGIHQDVDTPGIADA